VPPDGILLPGTSCFGFVKKAKSFSGIAFLHSPDPKRMGMRNAGDWLVPSTWQRLSPGRAQALLKRNEHGDY